MTLSEEFDKGETTTLFELLGSAVHAYARICATWSCGPCNLTLHEPTMPCLDGLSTLTQMNEQGKKSVPKAAPVDFVPKKWTGVVTNEGEVSKHAWEFSLLHETRAALRAGDLTVEGSQRYSAWDSDLYQADVWATRRDAWYEEQALPQDGEKFLSEWLDQLHRKTLHVAKRIAQNKNQDARVEGEKLILTPLEKIELPPEVVLARSNLVGLFPTLGLA